jgi:hypothetical protein
MRAELRSKKTFVLYLYLYRYYSTSFVDPDPVPSSFLTLPNLGSFLPDPESDCNKFWLNH